jgi:hypothetical protein
MLYELTMKLTSPFLGDQRTSEGVRRFPRSKDGNLEVPAAQWQWAFQEAIYTLRMEGLQVDSVRFKDYIAPSIVLYNRKWHEAKKQRTEMFEAIRENTELTIQFFVPRTQEPTGHSSDAAAGRSPTIPELTKILDFIGDMLGLSPWGSKFGYGKFKLLGIREL